MHANYQIMDSLKECFNTTNSRYTTRFQKASDIISGSDLSQEEKSAAMGYVNDMLGQYIRRTKKSVSSQYLDRIGDIVTNIHDQLSDSPANHVSLAETVDAICNDLKGMRIGTVERTDRGYRTHYRDSASTPKDEELGSKGVLFTKGKGDYMIINQDTEGGTYYDRSLYPGAKGHSKDTSGNLVHLPTRAHMDSVLGEYNGHSIPTGLRTIDDAITKADAGADRYTPASRDGSRLGKIAAGVAGVLVFGLGAISDVNSISLKDLTPAELDTVMKKEIHYDTFGGRSAYDWLNASLNNDLKNNGAAEAGKLAMGCRDKVESQDASTKVSSQEAAKQAPDYQADAKQDIAGQPNAEQTSATQESAEAKQESAEKKVAAQEPSQDETDAQADEDTDGWKSVYPTPGQTVKLEQMLWSQSEDIDPAYAEVLQNLGRGIGYDDLNKVGAQWFGLQQAADGKYSFIAHPDIPDKDGLTMLAWYDGKISTIAAGIPVDRPDAVALGYLETKEGMYRFTSVASIMIGEPHAKAAPDESVPATPSGEAEGPSITPTVPEPSAPALTPGELAPEPSTSAEEQMAEPGLEKPAQKTLADIVGDIIRIEGNSFWGDEWIKGVKVDDPKQAYNLSSLTMEEADKKLGKFCVINSKINQDNPEKSEAFYVIGSKDPLYADRDNGNIKAVTEASKLRRSYETLIDWYTGFEGKVFFNPQKDPHAVAKHMDNQGGLLSRLFKIWQPQKNELMSFSEMYQDAVSHFGTEHLNAYVMTFDKDNDNLVDLGTGNPDEIKGFIFTPKEVKGTATNEPISTDIEEDSTQVQIGESVEIDKHRGGDGHDRKGKEGPSGISGGRTGEGPGMGRN